MARTIRHEMPYDAPLDAVAAMLADPKFREDVCAYQRSQRTDVSITPSGEGMQVRIDYWLPTEGVPGFAKKFVGAETNILQEEAWSSPSHGDVTVTIPGKPGDMVGTATLTETSDGGTLEVVELTVKVAIPLVAGKLEDLIGGLLLKALKAEHRVGRDYLSA